MTMRIGTQGVPAPGCPGPELTEKKIAIAGQEVLGSGLHCPNAVTWAQAAVVLRSGSPGGIRIIRRRHLMARPPESQSPAGTAGALSLSGL